MAEVKIKALSGLVMARTFQEVVGCGQSSGGLVRFVVSDQKSNRLGVLGTGFHRWRNSRQQ